MPAGAGNQQSGTADSQKSALNEMAENQSGRNVDALFNVRLDVRVVLGSSRMQISELLELTKGSVIELDRKVGDPVDITINDRLVARGDLVKVNGDLIGVALREIVKDFISGD
ncbi:MAG: flagellar motor switch protein [Rhodobacteraceae bacterium]|nr:MAG: flagellar motor switch protein [Paracoccaceae bacterium]